MQNRPTGAVQPISSFRHWVLILQRGSNSTGTSSHSRIFDRPNTRMSSSSTLQSPGEAVKRVRIFALMIIPSDPDLDQDPAPFPAPSHSAAFTPLSQEIEYQDDFGDLFAGLDKRNSAFIDDNILSKPPAPVVLRTVCLKIWLHWPVLTVYRNLSRWLGMPRGCLLAPDLRKRLLRFPLRKVDTLKAPLTPTMAELRATDLWLLQR